MEFFEVFEGYSGPFELKIGFSEAYRCSLHMCEIFLKNGIFEPVKDGKKCRKIGFFEFFEGFAGCSCPFELKIGFSEAYR